MSGSMVLWLSGGYSTRKDAVFSNLANELRNRGLRVEELSAAQVKNDAPIIPDEDKWSIVSQAWLLLIARILLRQDVTLVASFLATGGYLKEQLSATDGAFLNLHLYDSESGETEVGAGEIDRAFDTAKLGVRDISGEILSILAAKGLIPPMEEDVYSSEEEEKIKERLESLGYL